MMKFRLRRSIHWSGPAAVLAVLATVFSPGPVQAAVTVRVESRPAPVAPATSSPIKVYVTVTDATTSQPVGGLLASDFTVKLDGVLVTAPPDFSLPPAQNASRNISVVFAMDFSPSTADPATLKAMQDAVIGFINSMTPGDYAAIVKFNGTQGAQVVQTFTPIDGGNGTSMLIGAVMAPYPGVFTNLYDGTVVALNQFSPAAVLPDGPKAVILLTDGDDNKSTATIDSAISAASVSGIPVFSIALPNATTAGQNVLTSLAVRTGGTFIPATNTAGIADAYVSVASLLDSEYLLTFQSSISDCIKHTVVVQVGSQTSTTDFTRCDAPVAVTPPPAAASSGGGGGGAFGAKELLAGLVVVVAVVARRRRRVLCSQMAYGPLR
jgi:hypothetical protein